MPSALSSNEVGSGITNASFLFVLSESHPISHIYLLMQEDPPFHAIGGSIFGFHGSRKKMTTMASLTGAAEPRLGGSGLLQASGTGSMIAQAKVDNHDTIGAV